jgi:hypothetical protein
VHRSFDFAQDDARRQLRKGRDFIDPAINSRAKYYLEVLRRISISQDGILLTRGKEITCYFRLRIADWGLKG